MEDWYYTRDGLQQGPVNLETLRDLAAKGELKPQDMVWNASMTDWVPSSEVDGIFSRPIEAGPTVAPGSAEQSTGEMLEIEPGSEPIDVGACIGKAFQLTKDKFLPLLGVLVVYIVVSIAIDVALGAIDAATGMGGSETVEIFGQTTTQENPSLINLLVSNVLSIFLSLGMVRIGLNIVDGKEFTIGQLFSGGPHLVSGFLASLLFGLMVLVGCLLLIVPGIYLALRFGPYMNAIVDRKMGVFDSLSYASQLTTKNRGNLFVLALANIGIVLAGVLALCVGLFFAYPLVFLSWIIAYRWMQYGRRVVQ